MSPAFGPGFRSNKPTPTQGAGAPRRPACTNVRFEHQYALELRSLHRAPGKGPRRPAGFSRSLAMARKGARFTPRAAQLPQARRRAWPGRAEPTVLGSSVSSHKGLSRSLPYGNAVGEVAPSGDGGGGRLRRALSFPPPRGEGGALALTQSGLSKPGWGESPHTQCRCPC